MDAKNIKQKAKGRSEFMREIPQHFSRIAAERKMFLAPHPPSSKAPLREAWRRRFIVALAPPSGRREAMDYRAV